MIYQSKHMRNYIFQKHLGENLAKLVLVVPLKRTFLVDDIINNELHLRIV